jgi:hypothetical protein
MKKQIIVALAMASLSIVSVQPRDFLQRARTKVSQFAPAAQKKAASVAETLRTKFSTVDPTVKVLFAKAAESKTKPQLLEGIKELLRRKQAGKLTLPETFFMFRMAQRLKNLSAGAYAKVRTWATKKGIVLPAR